MEMTYKNHSRNGLINKHKYLVKIFPPSLNEWIPTNKSLPEECIAVLVNCPTNKNIFCAYLEKGKWFIFSPIGNEKLNELVDAWMPLPNRYKEE